MPSSEFTFIPDEHGIEQVANGAEVTSNLARLGNAIVNNAKRRCPGPGNQLPGTTYRATGYLRSTISMSVSRGEVLVRAGADYASYVHDGTRYMPARPFLTDAMAEEVSRF